MSREVTRGKRFIDSGYLPPRVPIIDTAVCWLVLDRLDAPQWVWGALGLVVALAWIGSMIRLYGEKAHHVVLGDST